MGSFFIMQFKIGISLFPSRRRASSRLYGSPIAIRARWSMRVRAEQPLIRCSTVSSAKPQSHRVANEAASKRLERNGQDREAILMTRSRSRAQAGTAAERSVMAIKKRCDASMESWRRNGQRRMTERSSERREGGEKDVRSTLRSGACRFAKTGYI